MINITGIFRKFSPVGFDAVDDAFGEESSGGKLVGEGEELRAVLGGPHVESAGALEPIGEDFELLVGGDGEERGSHGDGGDGLPGACELRRGGAELGALSHLVDLAFAGEASFEELFGFLRLHSLPLPLRYASGECSGTAAHSDDQRRWRFCGGDGGLREE